MDGFRYERELIESPGGGAGGARARALHPRFRKKVNKK